MAKTCVKERLSGASCLHGLGLEQVIPARPTRKVIGRSWHLSSDVAKVGKVNERGHGDDDGGGSGHWW